MADLSSIYNFYYMNPGDRWYPGFDEENMRIADNQFSSMAKYIGTCVGTGWTVVKLSEERSEQLALLGSYLLEPSSEYSQKLINLNLNFPSSNVVSAGTTESINLSGGAPNTLDGINLQTNDKILVKDQNDKSENGVYYISNLGIGANGTWLRDPILNESDDFNSNFLVYVSGGVANTSTLWIGASLGMTFGTNNLYFVNAFNQCVKVYPGDGIVDIFYGKTEKPYFFRFNNEDDHYVWAEKTLNIEYNNACKIVAPEEPSLNYGAANNATYLATIVSSVGSTLYDLATIDSIVYGPNRRQFLDFNGEYQSLLKNNFQNHKHLSDFRSAIKINLQNYTILNAVNRFQDVLKISSTVFVLENEDGTLFTENLSNYGIPLVYLDDTLLKKEQYYFKFEDSVNKLFLKNSISTNQGLKIYLPNFLQKELICIDVNGTLLTSAISTITSEVLLSDSELEDRSPDDSLENLVFKNFQWNKVDYKDAEVYINGNLIQKKYYDINPYNGTIKILSSLPNYNSYFYDQLIIKLNRVGSEIQNSLTFENISDVDASTFDKGEIPQSKIKNLNHNYNTRYKINATYKFDKFLLSGLGNSYYYPENSISDLQYNTNVNGLFFSNNINNGYIFLTEHGLMNSSESFTNIKFIDTWNNDDGKPIQLIDDLLIPESENLLETTYVLTSDGKVFYSNDKFTTWQEFDLPFAENSKRVIVNTFDLSTDREEISLGQFQNSTYVYLGTDFGLYETRILEGQTQFEWSWSELSTYVNDDIVDLKNINKVKEISTKNILIESGVTDIITYDRHLYVGSSDPDNPGLYFGDNNFVKRIFTENVKGITWIQTDISKSNKNNIIWWNDYDVYLTHTARFIENESGSYWEHPFEIEASPLSDCVCATVGNITLSGLQTIDGYTVSSGQRVLVKNQTDKTQNGIYLANSSSWSRATDFDEDSDLSYSINVTILNGSENANTIWFLKYQDLYEIGMTNIEWDIFKKKIFSTSTPSYTATRSIIKNVIVRNSNLNNLEYLVIYDNGVSLIEEGNVFIVKDLIYDPLFQGSINNALSLNSTNFTGILYIATENGIYKSTEFLWKDKDTITDINLEIDPWIRTENVFTFNDSVLLINNANGNEIISYDKYYQWQLFHLQENIDIGSSISYEKDFRNFYINPWYFDFLDDQGAPIKHTVVVYVNNKPTTIPYITDSTTGLIQFVSSIDKKYYENVTISIFCNNQFLNNVGSLTHNEIFTPANSEIAIARLSLENNIDDLKLYLNQDINNNEKILRLDDGVQQEIVYISSIDNFSSPVEVTLTATRSSSNSTHTFSAGTTVYSIKDKLSNNIQDSLYNLVSKERYNLGSLNNINTNKMISKIDDEISNVFQITPSAPFSQNDTRGFINLKYTNDFVNDNIYDDTISITKHNIGTPDLFISENYEINNIYDIANLSKTADNSILLTDKGIWIYNDYRWELSYPTQNVVFYNIEQYNNQYKISSSNGIYIVDENFNITIDDDFKSEINNYYNGFFDNINCEVYSKDDGFVLVKNPDSSSFISEYSSLLDSKKVFSANKYQGLRVSDSSLNLYDILVVCASDGAYGICTGENDDIFANSLVTRKLFDMPSDVARIYKSFSPNQIPTIPVNDNLNNYLFLLTNNGLIRINNFRLCDPNIVGGLTFYQDNKFLTSLDCLCFLLDSEEAIDKNNPGKSKIFIGTNKGVYRSLDGGNSFEPAERFQNKLPLVNSLRIVKTNFISGTESIEKNVIVACTNIGLYYSIDDGDNWYKCNEQTSISEEPVNFSYYPSNFIEFSQNNTSNYLSQTFRCPNSADIIDKISVLLSIDKNKVNDTNYQSSFNNNYIEVSLCALDVNDKPDLSSILATSSSGSVFIKNLKENNFEYFQFNLSTSSNQKIALVIREVVTAGGISLLKWKKSQNYNLDYFGKSYTRYDGSWVKLDNSDNQLTHRIFFSSSLQPVENIVPVGVDSNGNVGWHLGKSRGLLIDDSGELISDIRFLVSLLIDDTKSMGRILSKFDFNTKIKNLIETLFDRSERIVGSETLNFTAIDILSLNNQLVNLTNNIFSNQKSDILNTINDLRNTGTFTGLLNGLEIASHGLFKNSVNAAMGNQIEDVITYLDNESLLRINDIIEQYNSYELDDDWDESINTIPDSEIATKLTLDSFADSYIPLLICLTDGENVSDNIIQDLKFYLNNYWDKNGFKLILFNLGKNKWQDDFYDLVYGTDSIHFQLNNSNDLQNAIDSLFHGELNNIFQSKWDRKFIYDEPKYISRIYTSYTVSTIETINSECDVQFRYSTDYENFTEWFSLSNNINFNLDKKITNIEYKVLMKEGWNGSPVKPSIQELYHVEVEPANAYLFSDVFEIDGYLNEYIISSNTSAVDFDLQFFISRENSNNLVDFFDVITNRNSVLPNRQKEYKATDEVIYENLILNPINDDFFEFEILKDGKVFKWKENYNEFVILNSNIIDSGNYRIDNNSGIIIFDQILENYQNITIKIVELSNTYISFGESTKTHDYCTYYAVNGSWKYNDNVVIFINNEIYRKNYILDNLSGSVTFYTKLDKSDIVTIYVQHPQTFKLCTKITSYDSALPSLINFDVQYNTSKNLNKISELQVVSKPYILDNRPRLKSSLNTVSNSLSINYPIHIEYFFASDFDTDENETITSWWIQKDIFFYEILEYTNRIIQKQSDLKALGSLFELGNEVYVKVQPKDKYKTGLTFNSENFVLSNLIKPFVYDVKIKTSSTIVNNRVQQNTELQSAYFYVSNIADASIIEWYDWSISNTPIYTGRSLPSSYVKSGSIISYKITPFDGTTYGDVVYSNYVYVF